MKPDPYDVMFLRPWEHARERKPIIASAKGIRVRTSEGKNLIDLTSGLFNLPFGHSPPDIIEAIHQQLLTLDFVGPSYPLEVRSEACRALYNHMDKEFHSFFFTPGGAEAIEGAMKFARQMTGRTKLVAAHNSYHGSTYGAQALSGDLDRNRIRGSPEGFAHFKSTDHFLHRGMDPERAKEKALISLQEVMPYSAAVFLEPFTGVNSFQDSPAGYLKEVQKICHENDTLLIFDEILTGFGRTGKMFAYQHHGVVPDMVCLGKNLTAGLIPQGATALNRTTTRQVHEKPLPLGHTYMGHPAACAATVAVLSKLKREKTISHSKKEGKFMLDHLQSHLPMHYSLRGKGLLMALETDQSGSEKKLIENGFLAHVENGLLPIAPPLNTPRKKIMDMAAAIEKLLSE